ncbi:hypothetical protein SODG_001417 [Sodalis praecaptivus]|uniref:hypothetical protein n=1 Tax=Sodalis praecaptivus TaxID=1239307 RepID=UPI0027EDCD79|nr:hypothetical protein [Sodalis praecaptivus]CAJ0999524.1 hypothetical protein NVIRENTERO_03868 [Sodalis praecaptivus]
MRQRVQDLRQAAAAVNQLALSARGEQAQRLNHALMRASRLLVPLNYTAGNRFCHDSALPHPAWPSLGGLRELAALPADSEEQPFYAAPARQSRNLAAHALREAHAALAAAIAHPS